MSNVQEHSREAYRKTEDTRESYGERIYKYLMRNPDSSDLDISIGTGIKINAVSAPRAQLIRARRVYSESTKVNEETGMTVKAWRVTASEGHGAFNFAKSIEREQCPFCTEKRSSDCTWCNGTGYYTRRAV